MKDKYIDPDYLGDPIEDDDNYSYYEEEVLPKIIKKRDAEIRKCQHNQFFIYCSNCKHVLGSESSDPYELMKLHQERHARGDFDNKHSENTL